MALETLERMDDEQWHSGIEHEKEKPRNFVNNPKRKKEECED